MLLGIVKYLWRDAVSRLNTKDHNTLKIRLSNLDVRGLGLSPLQGHTLVQYAGSLTGRDFRAIAQVGSAVLHDLLPTGLYSMWVALGRLVPLIYQSNIPSLKKYISDLEISICEFLKATALWNITWFNKPKFHLLLHLPANIQRFGPAVFFATEGFESYNAVIRSKSVHSNHVSISRDIGRALSYAAAIRHLVSGGLFRKDPCNHTSEWVQAGHRVRNIIHSPLYKRLMGMDLPFEFTTRDPMGELSSSQTFSSLLTVGTHHRCACRSDTPASWCPPKRRRRCCVFGDAYIAVSTLDSTSSHIGVKNSHKVPLNIAHQWRFNPGRLIHSEEYQRLLQDFSR